MLKIILLIYGISYAALALAVGVRLWRGRKKLPTC